MAQRISSPFGTVYVDDQHTNALLEALGEKRSSRHDPVSMTPEVDIYENDTEFSIFMDLPGVDKESIQVSLSGVSLSVNAHTKKLALEGGHWIRHERRVGEFVRSLHLGEAIDAKSIKANYADGTLNITIAKQTKGETHQIKVDIK